MFGESSIAPCLQNAFQSLPSAFAQLAFVSSLRDSYTGCYLHEGWASVWTPEEVDLSLRDAHRSAFETVVNLPLVALSRELRRHFQYLGQSEIDVANFWLQTEPYYEMIPAGCPLLSRRFFTSQFRLALEVLVHAPNSAYLEGPTASPLPPLGQVSQPQWLN
jgi:hypothetical protein